MYIPPNKSPQLTQVYLDCNGTHEPCKMKVEKVGNTTTETTCVSVQHDYRASLDMHLHKITILQLKPTKRSYSSNDADASSSSSAKQART